MLIGRVDIPDYKCQIIVVKLQVMTGVGPTGAQRVSSGTSTEGPVARLGVSVALPTGVGTAVALSKCIPIVIRLLVVAGMR